MKSSPSVARKNRVFQNLAGRFEHAFPARFGHHLVHGQRQADVEVAGSRPQGVDAPDGVLAPWLR